MFGSSLPPKSSLAASACCALLLSSAGLLVAGGPEAYPRWATGATRTVVVGRANCARGAALIADLIAAMLAVSGWRERRFGEVQWVPGREVTMSSLPLDAKRGGGTLSEQRRLRRPRFSFELSKALEHHDSKLQRNTTRATA